MAIPKKIQLIIQKYLDDDATYENAEKALAELKPLGYTFEYDLEANIHTIKKLSHG